jgi:hypothetical protein
VQVHYYTIIRPEPNVQFFFAYLLFSQIAPIVLPKLPIILKNSRYFSLKLNDHIDITFEVSYELFVMV